MTSNFNDKKESDYASHSLEELLQDTVDEKEKQKLTKAWNALGELAGVQYIPPKPSRELEMVFKKRQKSFPLNEELTDDELHMLAAAGAPGKNMIGTNDSDCLFGGCGDDTLEGLGGTDLLRGQAGADVINGGDGSDYIIGGAGDDTMHGDAGNDSMGGGEGDDNLYGDTGNDLLNGGIGNDTLVGGEGNDTLIGGEGGDVFVFNNNSGNDVISDFNPEEDSLVFEGLTNNDLSMVIENGNTIISYGDSTITLLGVELNEINSGTTM